MTSIEISHADITGLADKLDALDLSEGQRALLSAIVTMADHAMASTAEPGAVVAGTDPTKSFRDQFAVSFTPGPIHEAGSPTADLTMVMGNSFAAFLSLNATTSASVRCLEDASALAR